VGLPYFLVRGDPETASRCRELLEELAGRRLGYVVFWRLCGGSYWVRYHRDYAGLFDVVVAVKRYVLIVANVRARVRMA